MIIDSCEEEASKGHRGTRLPLLVRAALLENTQIFLLSESVWNLLELSTMGFKEHQLQRKGESDLAPSAVEVGNI